MSTRRVFLRSVITCAAAGACVACGSSGHASAGAAASGDASAGNVKDVALGAVVMVPDIEACVLRDAAGIYAMTLVCTHEGCDIAREGSVGANGIVCNCHGSQFDLNGKVLVGPATEDLPHFLVSVDQAGNLTVHSGTAVDPATRLPA